MTQENRIVINGSNLSFDPGETILNVAVRNQIDIPTLCHLKGATPTGECRICVIEIEGGDELLQACSTPAANGMVIKTESPKVIRSRKETIRQMLASGNHNCAVRGADNADWTEFQLGVHQYDGGSNLCPAWGDCRLQDLAYRYQVSCDQFSKEDILYPMEAVNPFIVRDFSRCIKCGRCVQACNEIQVNNAIGFGYEGSAKKIITPEDKPLKDSECVFCGECIQACPVGALVEKDTRYTARPWETKKIQTTCSYCGVGCQLHLHVKDNRVVKVTGVEGAPPNYGSLCVKGRFGFNFINSPERLTSPMIRENGTLRKASYEEAINLVAEKFEKIKKDYGADTIGVLTSARISNEENYMAQKFTRAVLKTNNIDHCARL